MTDYLNSFRSFNPQPAEGYNLATAGQGLQQGVQNPMASWESLAAFGQPTNAGFNGGDGSNYSLAGAGQGVGPVAPTGGFGNTWLGKDGNLGTVFGGIQALSSAYLGFQQMKQAKDALKFQKQAYSTNLANSTKTYNTSLTDRITGRTADHTGKAEEDQAYLKAHSL